MQGSKKVKHMSQETQRQQIWLNYLKDEENDMAVCILMLWGQEYKEEHEVVYFWSKIISTRPM